MTKTLKPLATALEGKGPATLAKRAWSIQQRYGPTAGRMDRALRQLADLLARYQCKGTFPITAAALGRNPAPIQRYQAEGIEFAVHGCYHVDHSQLSAADQVAHFAQAAQIFRQQGIQFSGFRAPYLRWNEATFPALSAAGFQYDSSPSLHWSVEPRFITEGYRIALEFYGAKPAADYPALPSLNPESGLVHIPYCLPDDEAIIERIAWDPPETMHRAWLTIFEDVHHRGELYNLGLHPERTRECTPALEPILQAVQQAGAAVWAARLDEINAWWRARLAANFTLTELEAGQWQLTVSGPAGTTLLAKGFAKGNILAPATPWRDDYRRLEGLSVAVHSDKRPLIGLLGESSPALSHFLRQQGYLLQTGPQAEDCAIVLHRPNFTPDDERPLLTELESLPGPLLRLARWPHGAFSAFCVTGDIDALTIWDYGLRFAGR